MQKKTKQNAGEDQEKCTKRPSKMHAVLRLENVEPVQPSSVQQRAHAVHSGNHILSTKNCDKIIYQISENFALELCPQCSQRPKYNCILDVSKSPCVN